MTRSSLAAATAERPRFVRHACLAGLLLAEVLYFTVNYDTQALDRLPSAWGRLIGWAPQLLRLSIAVVGVTLLVGATAFRAALQQSPVVNRRWPYFLAGHVCAVAVFAATTATVMGFTFPSAPNAGTWALTWVVAGALTLVMWALAWLPWSTWVEAASRGRVAFMWGLIGGTAAWAGGFLTEEFWRPLAKFTFTVVVWLVRLIYTDTIADATHLEVGTPTFSVGISPQCSGYEGIGLIIAFLGVHLWLSRKTLRFPHALLLLPIGAAAVWALNAVRIATLIVIGTSGWPDVALGGFHSQAGWLAFNAVGLGLVALTIRGRYFETEAAPVHVVADAPEPTAAYLGPFLAIVVASMVTGAFSAGVDWLYPVRVIAAAAVLWTCRKSYTDMRWAWSWQAMAIGAATSVIWVSLTPPGSGETGGWPQALGARHPAWAGLWLAIRVLGYVVTVPLAEELAFRGYLMRRLKRAEFHTVPSAEFAWVPWIVSSVLFGAMHGGMWVAGTIAGLLFGLAVVRRGALGDAVQAHATTNLVLVLYAATTGHWSVWS